MRKLANYIVYYKDVDGISEGFTVYGCVRLKKALKELHEIGATKIEVYKEGPDFENDKDDVILTNYC